MSGRCNLCSRTRRGPFQRSQICGEVKILRAENDEADAALAMAKLTEVSGAAVD